MTSPFAHACDWVARHVDAGRLSTGVLGIATSNGIELLEGFGVAMADDVFPLFSVTKPLVALAAVREVERGRLSLTSPLRSAVPLFGASRRDDVQLQHLMTHTSGITELGLAPAGTLLENLVSSEQLYDAGTVTRYNSLAFEGIAQLVALASGRSIEAAVGDISMETGASGLTFEPDPAAHRVDGIESRLDWDHFLTLRHPGAGMFGRAEDLLAIGRDLLRIGHGDAGILAPASLRGMLVPRTTGLPKLYPYIEAKGQEWGLTWNLRLRSPGLLDWSGYGHAGMGGVEWWIYPDLDLVFTFMTATLDLDARGVDVDQLHNAVVTGRAR